MTCEKCKDATAGFCQSCCETVSGKKLKEKILEEFYQTFRQPAKWTNMSDVKDFILYALGKQEDQFKKLITDEIAQAHLDGEPTSRLTSLYNKVNNL
jgi:hypothetical protein